MIPFATAHPYEVVCFTIAALAFLMTLVVFLAKITDLTDMAKSNRNGIVKFMQIDKVRSRGFVMAIAAIIVKESVSSINNLAEPTGQALNWITTGIFICLFILVDSFMVYRKRLTQFILVAEYDAEMEEAALAKALLAAKDPLTFSSSTTITDTHTVSGTGTDPKSTLREVKRSDAS
jgi:hypothetical protein